MYLLFLSQKSLEKGQTAAIITIVIRLYQSLSSLHSSAQRMCQTKRDSAQNVERVPFIGSLS